MNGATYDVRVPARRLLSDALRHDLGLTGTHVGCEHGVCGACTVLVDGQPMRSCLMFAVSAVDARITTVEGLTDPDGTLGPVQQAFQDCHALQCGFCTPGFLTTVAAVPRGQPRPHARTRPATMIAGNLCRCTGYQNIVKAVCRAAELRRLADGGRASGCRAASRKRCRAALPGSDRPMTSKLFGTKVPAGRGRPAAARRRAATSTTSRPTRCTRRCCAARTPTRGSPASTSTRCSTSTGVVAVYTYDDLEGPMAEPLPLLIPHPTLTHGRTQYALAKDEVNYVGEAIAFVVAVDRYVAEDALDRIRVTYDVLPPVVGIPAAREAALPGARRRTGQRRRPHGAARRRRRGRDRERRRTG